MILTPRISRKRLTSESEASESKLATGRIPVSRISGWRCLETGGLSQVTSGLIQSLMSEDPLLKPNPNRLSLPIPPTFPFLNL